MSRVKAREVESWYVWLWLPSRFDRSDILWCPECGETIYDPIEVTRDAQYWRLQCTFCEAELAFEKRLTRPEVKKGLREAEVAREE